jgi:hypothetical protein
LHDSQYPEFSGALRAKTKRIDLGQTISILANIGVLTEIVFLAATGEINIQGSRETLSSRILYAIGNRIER